MTSRAGARRPFDQDGSASRPEPLRPARADRRSFDPDPAGRSHVQNREASPLGGQALIEGVMIRGARTWATAVRHPDPEQFVDGVLPAGVPATGEIVVETHRYRSALSRSPVLRLPILRGVVAIGASLRLGFRALRTSAASQYEDPVELGPGTWIAAGLGALVLVVGLFFLAPVGLTGLLRGPLGADWLFWLVEGIVRTAIFLGYLLLVTRMSDLRRVFEYHGAEHQTIACYEAGLPLTPENAARCSRLHPRCGTSFLLLVMVVSIFVFAPLGTPPWPELIASRIIGIPLIAGIAFELLRFAGRHQRFRPVRALTWPGLQLQRLTTRPPDHDQLAVAIAGLQAILAREDPRRADRRDRVGAEVAA